MFADLPLMWRITAGLMGLAVLLLLAAFVALVAGDVHDAKQRREITRRAELDRLVRSTSVHGQDQ
jgi:hypothetical protein